MPNKSTRKAVNVIVAATALQVAPSTIHRLCRLYEDTGEGLASYRLTPAKKSPRRIPFRSIVAYAKKQGREIDFDDLEEK
jgi:hypothetical protein